MGLPGPFQKLDPYFLALLATALTASLLPASGRAAIILNVMTQAAIALLFFLQGVKLSREAVVGGLLHWRLHGAVLAITFGIFPLMGLLILHAAPAFISPTTLMGLVFLCLLPSTVQSSIAFTSVAGGNVAAAVCSASLSNLLGIFVTPLLVFLLFNRAGGAHDPGFWLSIKPILIQLLLPFLAGQLARPWLAAWAGQHRRLVGLSDRGSILLVVYGAFSAAAIEGLWRHVSPLDLSALLVLSAALLVAALACAAVLGRWLRLAQADAIVLLFCGSKKSLASGVPLAGLLFAPALVGSVVLPLMIFHQLQLMVCSAIAGRYARQRAEQPHGAFPV